MLRSFGLTFFNWKITSFFLELRERVDIIRSRLKYGMYLWPAFLASTRYYFSWETLNFSNLPAKLKNIYVIIYTEVNRLDGKSKKLL